VSPSEWHTRKQLIDKRLKSLNPPWKIVPYQDGMDTSQLHGCAVEEYPTESGPADYALFLHGKFSSIIEAKKVGVGTVNVLEQAKRYSRTAIDGCGSWGEFKVPLLYATNGHQIHFIDVRTPQASNRALASFHTGPAMEEMLQPQEKPNWFAQNPNLIKGLRTYQREAIESVEKAIGQGQRNMLLAMATGTGKTFMTVAQVHRMLESKSIRRVLFLVDRRALAAQAVQAFHSFDTPAGRKFPQEYTVYSQQFCRDDLESSLESSADFNPQVLEDKYLTSPDSTHTFVYVCTIQRMAINLFGQDRLFHGEDDSATPEGNEEEDAGRLDIPIHAFDVVIADECHRGYTGQDAALWGQVLEHFDAVRIGLTATPAAHTVKLFGKPVFRYTTDQAMHDGHLVDYEAVKLSSNVRIHGVFLKEGELVTLRDRSTGADQTDYLEAERDFASSEIEKRITVPDSNQKIIRELAAYAEVHQKQYGRFPKTLIFAANDLPHASHADQLVQLCREEFGRGDAFVQKITGSPSVDRPLQKIREFRNLPEPGVVVSVDMLSTGVDIPALEFIVFLRPVRSRILWVQMLGRGTRRCDPINKGHFTIFDCFDGTLIEYFKGATDFEVSIGDGRASLPIARVIDNIYKNVDGEHNLKVLVHRLHRIDREMSGEAREKFADLGIPDGNLGAWAVTLPQLLKTNYLATMQLLRGEAFGRQLEDYGKATSFWIADSHQDAVTSEMVFYVGERHLQPADYLEEFGRWVRENPDQVSAIQILLNSPQQWSREALEELRQELRRHSFGEEKLQRARRALGLSELADIISQIKHAANEQAPLLSAQERVDQAFERVTGGRTWSEDQQKWLGRIREHLVENLSVSPEDFKVFPLFTQYGGQGRMEKIFTQPVLLQLVEDFNTELAA
jgi:type I restriction enzyme R subunit